MTENRLSFIKRVYLALVRRLPPISPRAELIIHPTLTDLQKSYGKIGKSLPPAAFFDGSNLTIHISYSTTKLDELVLLLLHELSHYYTLYKFGENDPRWSDEEVSEKYADDRADKWIKKLKKEGWFENFKDKQGAL